jgi:cytosine/uracil/thiamine/allantoin permease
MPTGSGSFGICSDVCTGRAGDGTEVIMRALVAAIWMGASAAAASAQSFSASGQVGYLQEWELKASLARTVSVGKVE